MGKIKILKPKVHYAIWSGTCSKPARDLLASKSEDLFASMNPTDRT